MSLVVPRNGEGDALSYYVNKSAPENLVLKLFKNDKTPAKGDVAADYVEADFTGYAAKILVGANWLITEGSPSVAAYVQQIFTSTADGQNQNIYGYYLERESTGRIAHSQRFTNGPYNIANIDDDVKVTPRITLV